MTAGLARAYRGGVKGGDVALGKLFFRVRSLYDGQQYAGRGGLYAFAGKIELPGGRTVDGAHLGRIEKGERMPGADVMKGILPLAQSIPGFDPAQLVYQWLEANGLGGYLVHIRKGKK